MNSSIIYMRLDWLKSIGRKHHYVHNGLWIKIAPTPVIAGVATEAEAAIYDSFITLEEKL